MKKVFKAVIAAIMFSCLLALSGCSWNIACIRGTVTKITTAYIMIDVSPDDDLYNSYDCICVSLDVEVKYSMTDFNVGDEVAVYYDGYIAEIYPAQIDKVYAIRYLSSVD